MGCGPGFVIENLGGHLLATGVDREHDWVLACRGRGIKAIRADAYRLPFRDGAFDLVFCAFLLLWLREPGRAVEEMARVSRGHVLCLAEPDYGGRIDHPGQLSEMGDLIIEGLEYQGADPRVGRKLREIMGGAGLSAELGVHPGVWSLERLQAEAEDELAFLGRGISATDGRKIPRLRESWRKAIADGILFQYNPIFYALGRKT